MQTHKRCLKTSVASLYWFHFYLNKMQLFVSIADWHRNLGKQLWTWVLFKKAGCTYRDSNNNICSWDTYQNHYTIIRNVITEQRVIRFHSWRRARRFSISLTRCHFMMYTPADLMLRAHAPERVLHTHPHRGNIQIQTFKMSCFSRWVSSTC